MFKLITVLVAVFALSSGARVYPPGVNPALCPNYPYCDNALVALHTPTAYTAPGYPANVNPAACPNYPYCPTGSVAPYAAGWW